MRKAQLGRSWDTYLYIRPWSRQVRNEEINVIGIHRSTPDRSNLPPMIEAGSTWVHAMYIYERTTFQVLADARASRRLSACFNGQCIMYNLSWYGNVHLQVRRRKKTSTIE